MKQLLKLSLAAFLFLLLASIFQNPVQAQGEFTVDSRVIYEVSDSGNALVSHDITLENNFSTLYATTYTLTLENIDVQSVKATEGIKGVNQEVQADLQKSGDKVDIKVTFPDAVVGKGAKRHFVISYNNGSFAVKTGEVWEVSIPRLSDPDSFRNYSVKLLIPSNFGLEAYVSPKPQSSSESDSVKVYVFGKNDVAQTGITAGFGQFQVFTFNLSYHLENPLNVSSRTQIALPPDTAFQKIYFSKLEPKPETVTIDSDGNWLATYKLSPRQRFDVTLSGSVQIFASFRNFPKPTDGELSGNLKETEYWQVNDPQIKASAGSLKTPGAIYDYVSQNLKYDFTRVQPNVQRMGAKRALENPTQAICMEFTDLFIALARAAGIPARETNGYAYTENPELQPLSLVADVLHSWPEYYDREKGVWIPVDPTWGSTTGGVDYFTKLDLRHFAFVMHGKSATKPYPPGSYKLGSNPQKDVFVSFGKLPISRNSALTMSVSVKRNIPFFSSLYNVSIKNPGPVALYSVYPTVYFDGKINSRDFIEALPPFSSYELAVRVPFSLLGKDTPDGVSVRAGGGEISFSTGKMQVVLASLLTIFIAFSIVILIVLIKLKKITFARLTATIDVLYARFTEGLKKVFKKG